MAQILRRMVLSVVVFPEDDLHVAQCLEYDINAQGDSVSAAIAMLAEVLVGNMMIDLDLGREPLSTWNPAPKRYWELFKSLKEQGPPEPLTKHLPDQIPSIPAIMNARADVRAVPA